MLSLLLQTVGEPVMSVNAKTNSNNRKKEKKEKSADEHMQTHMQKKILVREAVTGTRERSESIRKRTRDLKPRTSQYLLFQRPIGIWATMVL